ncbi:MULTISPECIES: response regulator [unclassified Oceanispirochaeta]|uniref:hybrid sensor histidine kinase/response regulator n=1 Tax=unclassified Oceanispirochaeta TaxID=2635722 RepID=UPI000E09C806|nr:MULTISPECIES: response regulator [unclassified Oceanispirochaeta]MBF9016397.1 response regulator [Oceanispirochaeta sp. M2]NPD72859.1 response regulator [Oceanispirochaeta sp. M1]RDG31437.1 response regulator [Oceanispirochaeta sp. M1]
MRVYQINSEVLFFIIGALTTVIVITLLYFSLNHIFNNKQLIKIKKPFNNSYLKKRSIKKKLLESEERFQILVSNIPGAYYRCHNENGWKMIFLSEFIYQITGYEASDFIENKIRTYDSIILEDDRKKVDDVIRDGLIINDNYILEYRIVHKNGAIRWIYEKGKGAVSEVGETILDGVIIDITDRKIFEAKLKQSQEIELIGTLTSGYAHDMNNILGGISASSSLIHYLLEDKLQISNKSIDEYLYTINDCVRRASNAINQLIKFNNNDHIFKSFDLKNAIENTVKLCRLSFNKSVKIKTDLPKDAAVIMGNEDNIQQVLLNLLINAEHAMTTMHRTGEQWGGNIKLVLKSYNGGIQNSTIPDEHLKDLWHIEIEDEGVGIEKEKITEIFNPYYTTKSNSGTGLGLSMVNHIVMNHNGIVKAESKLGIGSIFHILLPKNSKRSIYQSQPQSFLSVIKGEGKILLVDDEEMILKLCKEMLINCGYVVIPAASGSEAMKIYNDDKESFNLIIFDFVLPDMSGYEFLQKIYSTNKKVKTILVSGYISDEQIQSMMKKGLNDIIHKPYSITTLSEKVHEVISTQV